MRDWCDIGNVGDAVTQAIQRPNRSLPTWSGALDKNLKALQSVLERSSPGPFRCNLGSKRCAFSCATETGTTGCCPRQRASLTIGYSDDGVVKRRMNVRKPIDNLALAFAARNWRFAIFRF